jgi:ribosomal protein S18 acetylase RimI-like enzyme
MEIEIRPATENEAPLIALLGRVTFDDTFGHLFTAREDVLDYLERTFSVTKITNSIKKTNNLFWLAWAGGLPVGYAKLKLHSDSGFGPSGREAQLQKIYVLQDFLGQGIGEALQQAVFYRATSEQRPQLWLSVLESNQRAIGFYKKHGFEKIGSHIFSIGREDFNFIAMSKQLL